MSHLRACSAGTPLAAVVAGAGEGVGLGSTPGAGKDSTTGVVDSVTSSIVASGSSSLGALVIFVKTSGVAWGAAHATTEQIKTSDIIELVFIIPFLEFLDFP